MPAAMPAQNAAKVWIFRSRLDSFGRTASLGPDRSAFLAPVLQAGVFHSKALILKLNPANNPDQAAPEQ
ncbi:hypothetical protein JCM17846_14740 [Iodidimonas nitroreducens]|uniref:Uncharacterized protein n=1 Tax=Iodidimonas nitroreducens TaxID=1236968 RepID=A0A5A7N648_9PROT|nr:hypothetical protein JCM17846_14740 [Iodidimonas nitroreducens]